MLIFSISLKIAHRPRRVMWSSSTVDWEYDEWLNVKHPPKGQRLDEGEGNEWICYDCKPGDQWLTEWWDGDGDDVQTAEILHGIYSEAKRDDGIDAVV